MAKKPAGRQARRDAIQGMTQAQYARRRGVSRSAIARAIAAGRIPYLKRTGRIDPIKADRAWNANTDVLKQRGRPAPVRGKQAQTLTQSKARREQALAELAELELAERRGELVPEARVRTAAFNQARQTRDQLMAVPDRLAPLIVGRMDQLEVHGILTAELRKVCQNIAGDANDPPPAPIATAAPPPAADEPPSPGATP